MSDNPTNDMLGGDETNEQEESNKRAALAGQWRTPPLPVFHNSAVGAAFPPVHATAPVAHAPSSTNETTQPEAALSATIAAPTVTSAIPRSTLPSVEKLPMSTEDYVKALQEAYLRGAEAASAMAAARHQRTVATTTAQPQATTLSTTAMQTTASCPDFQQSGVLSASLQTEETILPQPTPATASMPEFRQPGSIANVSMPPPVQPQQQQQTSFASTTMQPMPQPAFLTAAPVASSQHQQQAPLPPAPPRSISLPDMSSYAAQQEEEKRQKRLARNRASARLRRLRKKNLVDAYETEVGILEKTLAKLKAHEWGAVATDEDNNDPTAVYSAQPLLEALSMDRGQQELGPDERKQAAADILQQQLTFLQQLEELMQEQYVLYQICNGSEEFQELKEALQLTPEQMAQLQESSVGWAEEWAALQTVKESLVAMKENEWLWNDGVSSIVDQFMAILHKNQISKFLLWADHNVDAIDELDIVNAAGGMPAGPIFLFGADNMPEGNGNASQQQIAAASFAGMGNNYNNSN